MSPLVKAMLAAGNQSLAEFRRDIRNVKWSDVDGEFDFTFTLRDVPYGGVMRGRNADLVVTGNLAYDVTIALRVLLDGDAKPLST